MIRPALTALALLLTAAGLWALASKPVAAYLLGGFDDDERPDVSARIIRQAKAEAWDEGYIAGHEDARAVQPTYPQPTLNPYRAERKDTP